MVSCLGYLFVICLFSVTGWMYFSSRPLFLSCFFFGRSLGLPTDIHFDRCLANPACQRASQIFHTPVSDVSSLYIVTGWVPVPPTHPSSLFSSRSVPLLFLVSPSPPFSHTKDGSIFPCLKSFTCSSSYKRCCPGFSRHKTSVQTAHFQLPSQPPRPAPPLTTFTSPFITVTTSDPLFWV